MESLTGRSLVDSGRVAPVKRRVLPIVVFLSLAVVACGDDGESIFGTTSTLDGATTTTTSGTGDTTGTTAADTTTTAPTTTTTTLDPGTVGLDIFAEAATDPSATPPPGDLGSHDHQAAAQISAELTAAGVDLTGVGVYVFGIAGTGERMLVLSADAATDQLAGEGGNDLFETLSTLPSLVEASDITRFTLHYFDSDAEGDFVLTTTFPLQLLFDEDLEELPEDELGVQLVRLP